MSFLFKNYPLVKVIYLLIKSVNKIHTHTEKEIEGNKQREINREK